MKGIFVFIVLCSTSLMAQITFENPHQSFDTTFSGDPLTHVYYFRNDSNRSIGIDRVRASCGCTTVQWPQDSILPGGRDSFVLVFRTYGRVGRQQKKAWVRLGPKEPELNPVSLKGVLLKPRLTQTISRTAIDLPSVGKQDTIVLSNYGEHPVLIDSVTSSCPFIQAIPDTNYIKPGYMVPLRIENTSDAPLDCDEASYLHIHFSGFLRETHEVNDVLVRLKKEGATPR